MLNRWGRTAEIPLGEQWLLSGRRISQARVGAKMQKLWGNMCNVNIYLYDSQRWLFFIGKLNVFKSDDDDICFAVVSPGWPTSVFMLVCKWREIKMRSKGWWLMVKGSLVLVFPLQYAAILTLMTCKDIKHIPRIH